MCLSYKNSYIDINLDIHFIVNIDIKYYFNKHIYILEEGDEVAEELSGDDCNPAWHHLTARTWGPRHECKASRGPHRGWYFRI